MRRGKRERAYDEQIAPLIREITRLAFAHDVPFVASFQLTQPQEAALAGMASSWNLPPWCSETLVDMIERAVPNWQEAGKLPEEKQAA